MESAEHRCHHDRFRCVDPKNAVGGHPLSDSLMRPRLVEVDLVPSGQGVEVLIAEQQDVIEDLASDAADEALGHGVHVGGPDGDLDDPDSGSLRDVVEGRSELVVAVAQEHLRRFPIHGGIPKLLRRPLLGGAPGRGHMDDSSRREVDDEEGIDLPEEDVVGLDEVAGPRTFGMVPQEGCPCLFASPGANPSHVLLDGALADLDAQFEEFPADALGTPESAAAGHVANEFNGL